MGQKIQAVKGMNDLLPVEQKDFKLTAAPSPTAAVFPWLCQSLPDALAKEADGDTPEALAAAAQKYAVVSLDIDSEKWCYNEWSGFWHDTEQT